MIDLEPAARRLADLVAAVTDDQLAAPTVCPAYSLGDLVDHVDGLSQAFTAAATKELGDGEPQGPSGDASRLTPDFRVRIPGQLTALAEAWRDPQAWTGMTQAGGVDLPGEIAGLVALNELVVHGWDVATASGQAYQPDDETLRADEGFLAQFSGPGNEDSRGDLFGPEVAVPADAPLLDRLIGMAGRDPGWRPA
ncbi:MAG: TIGR03086 family metal-binding protein [Ilumatobacteraceae bacterium]